MGKRRHAPAALTAIVIVILILAILLLLVFGMVTGRFGTKAENQSITVGEQMKEIGELATYEYDYTMVETAERPKKEILGLKLPFTGSKVIYSYDGTIKAGIDFSQTVLDVNEASGTITVTLPEAGILSSEVDTDSLAVYDENNSPFNALRFEDMNLSVSRLKSEAEQKAVDKGLLENARENAETIIRNFLNGVYDLEKYRLEFK